MTTPLLRLWWRVALTCIGLLPGFNTFAATEKLPDRDLRSDPPKTLHTLRAFPEIRSKAEWESRARDIRERILVSCGLWPMPEKTPLKPVIFGKVVRGDYSVEKVYLQ